MSSVDRHVGLWSDLEIAKLDRYALFALSDVQEHLIWRSEGVELENIGCFNYTEVEVIDLNSEHFEAALQKMIERHEMMRCVVLSDGRQQILARPPKYVIQISDFRRLDTVDAAERLDAIRAKMSRQVHVPDRWPLFEFRISRLDERLSGCTQAWIC